MPRQLSPAPMRSPKAVSVPTSPSKWEHPNVTKYMQSHGTAIQSKIVKLLFIHLSLAILSLWLTKTKLRSWSSFLPIRGDYVLFCGYGVAGIFTVYVLFEILLLVKAFFTSSQMRCNKEQRRLLGLPESTDYVEGIEEEVLSKQQTRSSTTPHTSPLHRTLSYSPSPVSVDKEQRTEIIGPRSPTTPHGALQPRVSARSPFGQEGFTSPQYSPLYIAQKATRRSKGPYGGEELIVDHSQLKQFKTADDSARAETRYPDFAPVPVAASAQPLTYHTSPRAESATVRAVADDDNSYANYRAAEELLLRLGVDTYIDDWTDRCRKWLAQHILRGLLERIQAVDQVFVANNMPQLVVDAGDAERDDGQLRMALSELAQRYPKEGSVVERVALEKYVDLPGYTQYRGYIIDRIKELGKGRNLAAYRWDSGGSYKGKPWHSDLPADAHIMMHVFCTFMDVVLLSDPRCAKGRTFSQRFFMTRPAEPKPENLKSDIVVYQSCAHPPHYKIVNKDGVWPVMQGRNSLFHSLVLFLHYIKINHSGYLGPVNLGTVGLDLLAIVEAS
eukprot:Colp12_sorted_trinity150504_noHs@17696